MKSLSICIPIYNFNCIGSIKILCKQISSLKLNAEILVIDDASDVKLNELSNFNNPFYTYEKLSKNIGRSKIRNLLVEKSRFDYILFLDGDSGIPENFIKNYLQNIESNPNSVICGGRIHEVELKNTGKLRYNYGVKFEDTKSSERSKKPYYSFMTNNFISPKAVLKNTPFNEELTKYGQEDTFFGYELKNNYVKIIHIDNPVFHLDLETNLEFIEKTKFSIENLILLKTKYPEFIEFSKLLTTINNYKVFRLKPIKNIASILSKFFEFITKHSSNAYSFQMFKLFYTIFLNRLK